MATEKQVKANQLNSIKSTGPITDEGKKKVSQNAVKHGLLAKQVVLDSESAEQFEMHQNRLFADLRPIGWLEELLVEKISIAFWRLRRLYLIETALFRDDFEVINCDFSNAPVVKLIKYVDTFNALNRYETSINRQLLIDLYELQRVQTARMKNCKSDLFLKEPLSAYDDSVF